MGIFFKDFFPIKVSTRIGGTSPGVGFDRFPKLTLAKDFYGGSPTWDSHPLIAKLGDESGAGLECLLNHGQFFELMDKGLLTIDMFVLVHGGQKDRGVRVIWHGDNDGVELIAMLCESLPVILASEGVRMIFGSLGEVIGIEVAETDDFGEGMTGDLGAVEPANRADHANGEHAEFAVLREGVGARETRRR